MTSALATKGRRLAIKTLAIQCIVALLTVVSLGLLYDLPAAYSAAWGALTCLVPSAVFAFFAFRFAGANQNKRVVRSFNQGSKLKLLMTFLFFVIAFAWLKLMPGPVFCGFAITLVSQWGALFFYRH